MFPTELVAASASTAPLNGRAEHKDSDGAGPTVPAVGDTLPTHFKRLFAMDCDKLIALVQDQPPLWDKSHNLFKDLTVKEKCWLEVAGGLVEKWEELPAFFLLAVVHLGNLMSLLCTLLISIFYTRS